ncbi:MAG: cupin domain-containing protein [Ignavibacteriales bacterium]|nr:cupin domain-containing protein [Ignavibacteriales bacterium]
MILVINILTFILGIGMLNITQTQYSSVASGVYSWPSQNINSDEIILVGETTDLKELKIFGKTILPGKSYVVNEDELDYETLLIFKKGKSKLSFGNDEKVLDPGSISIIYAGEKYQIENVGNDNAEFYLFNYKSIDPMNKERGNEDGGSFVVDWNDVEFTQHDKGGVRQYCERATEMLKYFSLHVTTLNPGINSHEPHTHTCDEMVIMIEGSTEMQIGNEHFNGNDGDVYFLGANIPHAINNVGKESCMYYAFHWE